MARSPHTVLFWKTTTRPIILGLGMKRESGGLQEEVTEFGTLVPSEQPARAGHEQGREEPSSSPGLKTGMRLPMDIMRKIQSPDHRQSAGILPYMALLNGPGSLHAGDQLAGTPATRTILHCLIGRGGTVIAVHGITTHAKGGNHCQQPGDKLERHPLLDGP